VSERLVWIHDVDVVDETFDDWLSMLDYPALVVTTQAAGQPAGCLVSFATQISVEPPRFLVGVAKSSHTFGVASRSQHLAVHVLSRRHRALAELFGSQTGHQINKFDRCSWRAGPQGMPMLDDAIAWFVGRTVNWIDAGDHVAYLLEPVATWAPETFDDPLYLSDIDDVDDDLDGGHEVSQRLFDGAPRDAAPRDVTRRYGLRFTLDGL
jgi:flavin reductase (DIM6/NTAB) family NADH-FMN oxidoreductase RutF